MTQRLPFIAYASITDHAVTSDRRIAALVASDGTLDWLCAPTNSARRLVSDETHWL